MSDRRRRRGLGPLLTVLSGLALASLTAAQGEPAAAPEASLAAAGAPGSTTEPQRKKKGPIIKMAKGYRRMHHFGEVLEGGQESFTFGLITTGQGDLVVNAVTSNCGCSIGEVSRILGDERVAYEMGTPLPPGSRLEVEGLLDTFGAGGPFSTTLAVRSNSVDRVLTLNMRAKVQKALIVEPDVIDVDEVLKGPVTVTIRDNGIGPVALHLMKVYQEKGQEMAQSPLSVELVPIDPEHPGDPEAGILPRASHWEARLSLNADRLQGNQVFEVRLGTDVQTPFQPPPLDGPHPSEAYGAEPEPEGPRMYQAWFRVKGEIERGVAINPPLVSFGKVEGGEIGQPIERRVTVRSRDGHVFPTEPRIALERLRPEGLPADAFTWEVASRTDQRIELLLRLNRLPEDFQGSFEGVLTVQLDHPTLRTGRVRFTGARR